MDKLEFRDDKTYRIIYNMGDGYFNQTIFVEGKDLTVNQNGYFKAEKYYSKNNRYQPLDNYYYGICADWYKEFYADIISGNYKEIKECKDISLTPYYDQAFEMELKKHIKELRLRIKYRIKCIRESKWFECFDRDRNIKKLKEIYNNYKEIQRMLENVGFEG